MITDILATSVDHVPYILAQYGGPPVPPPEVGRFETLMNIAKWFCIAAGVCALMFAGALFGYEKFFAHGDVQSPKKIAAATVGGVVVSAAGAIMQFTQNG